jgi:hypothetical protein
MIGWKSLIGLDTKEISRQHLQSGKTLRHFHPSLIFAGRVRSLPLGWTTVNGRIVVVLWYRLFWLDRYKFFQAGLISMSDAGAYPSGTFHKHYTNHKNCQGQMLYLS